MTSIRRFCMIIVALTASFSLLKADTVEFKDGTSLECKVIAETDDVAIVQFGEGKTRKLSKRLIDNK